MLRNKNILVGPPDPLIPAHLSFSRYLLTKLIAEDKERPALINGENGDQITFGEFLQKSVNAAVALNKLGVKKGDVIGFCSENRFEFMVAAIAVLFNGGIIANLNITYAADEMKYVCNISKPKYMFCSSYVLSLHQKTFMQLKFIKKYVILGEVPKGMKSYSYSDLIKTYVDVNLFDPVDVSGEDLAVINCSSGTTGLPKGVMITQMNLLYISHVMISQSRMENLKMGKLLTVIPWFHAYGFCSTITYLVNNFTVVYLSKFEPEVYLNTIQKYKIQLLLTVPPMLVYLAKSPIVEKYDLTSVLDIACGAAPISIETINVCKKRFANLTGVYQGYGMTELTLGVIRDNVDTDEIREGSTGKLLYGVRAKVVDIETEAVLGPNQPGELRFKGSQLAKGYMGQPKATAEMFDEDGFLKTGDVGYFNEDGYFFIIDRIKELVKYKGYQVPPAEVEAVILEHPGVLDCGVVGRPDEAAGELPTAFVAKRPGATVTEKEIINFVAGKLSKSKQLHGGVIFVKEIPKNPSGKILRRKLKEQLKTSPKSKI